MEHFKKLTTLKLTIEERNKLKYVSWVHAWQALKLHYPDSTYRIFKFENNLPYVFDKHTGYMVFTDMTVEGITHEMFLPVLDASYKAQKHEKYSYWVDEYQFGKKTGKKIEKFCEAATMFDINKTIMRCLTKNMAMFGLGIHVYADEDLPKDILEKEEKKPEEKRENSLLIPQEDERKKIIDQIRTLAILKNKSLDVEQAKSIKAWEANDYEGVSMEILIRVKEKLAKI